MDRSLDDLVNRCIARSKKPLSQLRTRSLQSVYSVYMLHQAISISSTWSVLVSLSCRLQSLGIVLSVGERTAKIGKPPMAFRIGNQRAGGNHTVSKSSLAYPADTSPASILNTKSSATIRSHSLKPSLGYVNSQKIPYSLSLNPADSALNAEHPIISIRKKTKEPLPLGKTTTRIKTSI